MKYFGRDCDDKGQEISEGNCGVLNSSKDVFLIFAIASKMGQIKIIKANYYTN